MLGKRNTTPGAPAKSGSRASARGPQTLPDRWDPTYDPVFQLIKLVCHRVINPEELDLGWLGPLWERPTSLHAMLDCPRRCVASMIVG